MLSHTRTAISKASKMAFSSKSGKTVKLSGIFPPITTPFNGDESIAFDKLDDNMRKWTKIGFGGFVVMGTNGEAPLLTSSEKVSLVKAVKKWCHGTDHVIVAGAGQESTVQTISLCHKLAEAGADAALVITPSYFKGAMTPDALKSHYTNADASPIPLVLYNMPANTGVELTADLCVELATHENIVGLKDSGGDIAKITRVAAETAGEDFQVVCGSAGFLLPGLQVGAVGGVCASANCLGPQIVQLYHEFCKNGATAKAVALQARLVAPNAAVTRGFGIAGLKYALDRSGFYGGPLRSPLSQLNQEKRRALDAIFAKSGFAFS